MPFDQLLKDNGWSENGPWQFKKGDWRLVFDTSFWIEVGTIRNQRIFDIPVPECGKEAWTLKLIEHLCATDDQIQDLKDQA